MPIITNKTFWLPLDQTSNQEVVDAVSGNSISIPIGNAVGVNCAAFFGDPKTAANLDSLTGVTSMTLSIHKSDASGDLLYQGTVASASFNNPGCTYANWGNQSDYQFGFALAPTDTNWSITGTSQNIWWSINAQTANGPVLLGTGVGTIFLSGLSATPSTVVNDPTYLTADQVAAAIAAAVTFYPSLTGLTGGGSSNLDGLATTAFAVGTLREFVIPGQGKVSYQLQSGTAAANSPGIIHPTDYNASTNAKIWVEV
jgi:hypothetical protein